MKRAEARFVVIKQCRCCKDYLSPLDFIHNNGFKSGYDTICKVCNRQRVATWRKTGNRDTQKESALYYERYPDKGRLRSKNWRSLYKDKVAISNAKQKTQRRKRHSNLDLEFTQFVFEEAHQLRLMRNVTTNILWEVDHILPLNGKLVSGLHVWNNLQVIPAIINRRKSNKYDENKAGY